MLFAVSIVVNAHKQNVSCVLTYFLNVLAFLYLPDGFLCRLTLLQLNDECRLINMLAGKKNEVGITISRWQFAMNYVFVTG